jgi:type I restriction enzyme M protein
MRGGMDASQYSDKAASQKGYLLDVPKGGSFADMVALKGNADIGDKINKIISKLADKNPSLKGAIDVADLNDEDKLGRGKEMVDRLTNLIGIFENPSLDVSSNRAEGADLLGDAHEYRDWAGNQRRGTRNASNGGCV